MIFELNHNLFTTSFFIHNISVCWSVIIIWREQLDMWIQVNWMDWINLNGWMVGHQTLSAPHISTGAEQHHLLYGGLHAPPGSIWTLCQFADTQSRKHWSIFKMYIHHRGKCRIFHYFESTSINICDVCFLWYFHCFDFFYCCFCFFMRK